MRFAICCIGILAASSVLVGCGQSGTLQLPNDPNYDKRAKYLIYKDAQSETQNKQENSAPVQQQFSAPSATDSVTNP